MKTRFSKKAEVSLSPAYLRSLFRYDPETGYIYRLVGRSNCIAGSRAGGENAEGYWKVRVDGISIYAQRLAWVLMTGAWPEREVDHRSRKRGDNSWDNLRLASIKEQTHNKSMHRNNTSGHHGVSFHKATGKWGASIGSDRKQKHLGLFDDKAIAAQAVRDEAKVRFGEFYDPTAFP